MSYSAYMENLRSYVGNLVSRYRDILGNERGSLSLEFAYSEPTYEAVMRAYHKAYNLWEKVVSKIKLRAFGDGPRKRYMNLQPIGGENGSFSYINEDHENWERINVTRYGDGRVAIQGESSYPDIFEAIEARRGGHLIKELAADGDLFHEHRR